MDWLDIFIISYAVLVGLFIGSFLNVVAIRMLNHTSIAFPPSHCMNCNHRLKLLDLIPVFSYLFLRGKCRYCKQGFSFSYPTGEAITGLMFGLVTWQIGWNPELLVGLFFISILIVVVQTDLRSMLIPNTLVFFGIVGAILLRFFHHPLPWWNYVAAAFIGSGLLLLIAIVSKGGMGGGDIKLFVFIGIILGIKLTLFTLFVSSLLGTLFGIYQIIRGKFQRGKHIPFGPFIAMGSILVYLWGDRLIQWYLELYL
jgi:leader peptidase (prepilin peptidase)/N-methyltransferase